MNKWTVLSGILFATLLGGLLGGSSVSAASEYDDLIRTTDTLEVNQNGYQQNLTVSWYSELLENEDSTFQGTKPDIMRQCLVDRFNDEIGWGVSQSETTSGIKQVIIYCANSENDPAEFLGTIPDRSVQLSNSIQCTFFSFSSALKLTCDTSYQYRIVLSETTRDPMITPQYINYNVTYPAGYEGEIIPDTYTPPVVFEPELSAYYSWTDKSIIFRDTTNYDVLPDECWVQMPNNQYGDNFTEYYYDCSKQPDVPHTIEAKEYQTYIIIQFARKGNVSVSENYSIDIDGRSGDSDIGVFSASNFFNRCVDYEPPFLHVEDCQLAFGVIGKTLSFGTINPLSDIRFEQLTECRQLDTLGSWINYENKLVCPAFNSTVRNVVTPFVAFGLSLTALGFVINRTARDFQ